MAASCMSDRPPTDVVSSITKAYNYTHVTRSVQLGGFRVIGNVRESAWNSKIFLLFFKNLGYLWIV